MSKISFIVFALFLFLFLFPSAEAGKEPLWEWESSSGISHVAISGDSRNISATYATSVSLWHNDTTHPRETDIVEEEITSMVMSSDGKYVLTGEAYDTTVTLWEEGSRVWETSDFLQTIIELDISPNGTHIAVADWKNVLFFNKDSNEAVWSYNHASEIMTTISISPDGLFIAAGTEDGKVYVYPTSGDNTSSWFHDNVLDGEITGIDFSADSSRFIIGTETGRVYVYETEEGPPVMELAHPDEITCVSGSSDSDYYAFGTDQGSVVVINSNISNIEWEKNIDGTVTDIDFNGNATHLVAGSTSKRLVLAKVLNGDELWRIIVSGEVSGVAMSYRGENIVVGTDEGLAIYYEQRLDNQAPVATIESITPSTALPGTPIVMNGSAVDSDGVIVDYLWNSSKDGNLSNQRIFTVSNLTMGIHVISFSAQDNEGRWSKVVSVDVGIGDFPEAEITSVMDCDLSSTCVITEGVDIFFNGSAASTVSNDTGIIGYHWSSSIDGNLSDQMSFNTSTLSLGTHTITFRAVNDIGWWSANVTMSLLINGVPGVYITSIDEVNIFQPGWNSQHAQYGSFCSFTGEPVVWDSTGPLAKGPLTSDYCPTPHPHYPGDEVLLTAYITDPEGSSSLTLNWSSSTLFFANGLNTYESNCPCGDSVSSAMIVTMNSDTGSHEVYVRVVDSYGISSESFTVTIVVLSSPIVSAICDEEAELDQDLLFNAIANDKDGSIVRYEWDFDSASGDIDSVDFQGASFATHSYNSTPIDSYYTVVVRVTDNDGLVARDTCTVEMMQPTPSSSAGDGSSSGSALDSISEIASPSVMAGIGLIVLIVGAVAYYMMSRDEMPYVPPTTAPVTGAQYMSSIVPEVSQVRQSEVVTQEIVTETMTVECPECSARMDIPNISGAQPIQCSECGLEGEIEL